MATILVIENEDFVRENILELLEAEGFSAIGAANGLEGLFLLRHHTPSLILCDVLMPDFSGYDVLQAVRQQSSSAQIPFVFLSAEASHEDTSHGLISGADYYLPKPFSIHELLRIIYGFIDQSA